MGEVRQGKGKAGISRWMDRGKLHKWDADIIPDAKTPE